MNDRRVASVQPNHPLAELVDNFERPIEPTEAERDDTSTTCCNNLQASQRVGAASSCS